MTVQSYQDKLDFGITADRKAVPDVDALADLLEPALAELKEAAQKLATDVSNVPPRASQS